MTGLEKIIERINQKSEEQVQQTLDSARRKVDEILHEAENTVRKLERTKAEESANLLQEELKKAESAAAQKNKRRILSARVQVIEEVLAQAYDALDSMDEEHYFSVLADLAVSNAMPGDGVIRFSAEDLARLPSDFIDKVNAAISKESRISTDKAAAPIKNGFILAYGDVEINCSFDALMQSKREELKVIAANILF